MMNEERPFIPPIIVTPALLLSAIMFLRDDDFVVLMGLYTDPGTGDEHPVEVETNFSTLNNLLQYEINDHENDDDDDDDGYDNINRELAIERLVDRISSSESEVETIEFFEEGGVKIDGYLLSLVPLSETDEEEDGVYDEESLSYMIAAYAPNDNIVAVIDSLPRGQELLDHYRRVLAARYAVYIALRERFPEPVAAEFSLLKDPLVCRMAEMELWQVTAGKNLPGPGLNQ